jgi:hypothetical protein
MERGFFGDGAADALAIDGDGADVNEPLDACTERGVDQVLCALDIDGYALGFPPRRADAGVDHRVAALQCSFEVARGGQVANRELDRHARETYGAAWSPN